MGMSAEEVVDAFIAAINGKDVAGACELLADEVEYDNVPMAKVFGRSTVEAMLSPMIEGCSEVDWVTHRQACTGGLVMNERLDRFHMPHGWLEVPVAGVFEVDGNAKISLWRDYFDLATFTSQMPSASE